MISRRHFLLSSLATGAGLATSTGVAAPTPSKIDVAPHGNGYARLFPARPASQPGSTLEKALSDLVLTMKDDDSDSGRGRIAAGYTYLGQFIDHDLTLDITPLDEAWKDPREITNFRTPFLDLDQLYGGGPNISRFLYRKHGSDSPEGEERFLIGKTKKPNGEEGSEDDLPRNSQGVALVGDSRQDENLVLAQLHVAFLKLHNLVLDRPELLRASRHYDIKPSFEATRRVVRWHYQWIIRNDFLKTILDPDVFEHLSSHDYKPLIEGSTKDFRIPVEFSAAAFRFGHSMVRNGYLHNKFHDDAKLDDLFQRTGFGKTGSVPLPEEWVIEWEHFFPRPWPRFGAQRARKIDTKVADGLFHLPSIQMRAFNMASTSKSADPPELPLRTLLRGARMGLPSGEQVAAEVARRMPGVRIATKEEIESGSGQSILTDPKNGLRRNTPLWYYILKEAEVLQDGNHLGPVGSRIVADVIVAALAADPKSYLSVAGPDWKPTLWNSALEKDPLEEMSKLLKLVAPDHVTKGGSNT
jgi:Animal haem peroxidase